MKKHVIIMIMAFTLVLWGCSAKKESETITTEEGTDKSATPTESATPTAVESTTEVNKDLILPVTVNDTGKVLIQTVSKSYTGFLYNSYIITSTNGESVVVDPTSMPEKSVIDINPVAIASTHPDADHNDPAFTKAYDVPKLLYKKGEIKTNDFNIYSILSSHNSDTINEKNSNIIVVFEVDGLRIAHMGDIGQTSLTEEQLSELGEIDIAFMQFENSYSGMSLENEKGFKIIEQLNPKIIIPTHYGNKALPVLEEKYGAITQFENILEISKDSLPDTNLNVYRILNKYKYK